MDINKNGMNLDKKRKIYGTILGIFMFILLALGVTYAYYQWSSNNSEKTNVNLTVSKGLENAIIYNAGTSILGTDNASLEKSSDYTGGISATIEFWKVATVTSPIYGTLNLKVLNMLSATDTLDANIKESTTAKWALTTYTATNSEEVYVSGGNFLGKNINDVTAMSADFPLNNFQTFYKVYLWIDETDIDFTHNISGELLSVEISASATDTAPASLLMLNRLGLTSNGELELPITDVETSNAGIFEMEDDLGTSYYFRGAATNNYVKFGKWKTDWYDTGATGSTKIASAGDDMYWRIVRINGDGTIRMIYDGTQAYANATGSSDTVLQNGLNRSIGETKFNTYANDNAYLGYMYGTPGASTYEQTHANTNNSTIKTYIDNWYQTQISGTTYESNIADAIYCNDRTLNSGTGIGSTNTYYGFYGRQTNPTLICEQTNDQFTLTTSDKGNKKLTYPVGLITVDEVVLAGGKVSTTNSNYYLITGTWYWSGAPNSFLGGYANAWGVYVNGKVRNVFVDDTGAVRPLVSLSSSTNFTGSGTLSDPFVISNNG